MSAAYLKLVANGELDRRVKAAFELLNPCRVCPRSCRVNRLKGKMGFCGIGLLPKVASVSAHFGEEPPISGVEGSGTIFFSGCNMRCVFCQNYPISQLRQGQEITIERLAADMLKLKKMGCHNLNLVTPSHMVPQILAGLSLAVKQGFDLPIVYNTGGYDSLESLRLLEGVVDIYLPDIKYSDEVFAHEYSGPSDYCEVNRKAVLEMHRQAGELVLDSQGIASRGLVIRHLVLPDNISGTEKVLRFIAQNLSPRTHVSLMGQYFPANRAGSFAELNRRLSSREYEGALTRLENLNLANGWVQEEDYAQAQGY